MKTLKTALVAFASFVIFTNTISAQALPTSYSVKDEETFAVEYRGVDGNYLVFQVVVNSPENTNATFELADKNEGELYSNHFRVAKKTTTYKIEKRDNQELNFKLMLGRKVYSKSFFVNTEKVDKTVVEPIITML